MTTSARGRALLVAAGVVATLAGRAAVAADAPVSPPTATPTPTPTGIAAGPAAPAPPSLLPVAVRLSGYIQADGVLHDASSQDEVDPSNGAPLNQTRYLLRRARLHLDIDHARMSGSLELDANTVNGPAAGVIDAEVTVNARTPDPSGRAWGNATIGLLRTPWGYEVNQRDQDRFFLERSSVSRALFPGVFDLGVRLRGGWRFIDVQIAMVNGDPLGDRAFPVQDPNHAKDIVGRLGVSGARGRVAFAAGLSGLTGTGFHRGTSETKDVLVWRDQNEDGIVQLSEIQVIPGSAATPSQDFHRFALGADARLRIALPRLGALEIIGEAIWATNLDRGLAPADPVATGRDLRERGWVAGFVQELGKWCAVGGRYDRYDPDADASEQRAQVVLPVDAHYATWTATAAWRWTELDRIVVEYQHLTNPLGRTAAGVPTTLGGETVLVRGQLGVVTAVRAGVLAIAAAGAIGCRTTADADIGLGAQLRALGAQFVAGDLDMAAPGDGPAVVSVFNSLTAVQPGEREKPLTGTLDATATTVALGLRGDRGYWIVVAGPPSLDAPDLPTFMATLSFAPTLPLGPLTLVARAVDAQGRFGAPATVPLDSAALPPPAGTLVVSLSWDSEADLDLHLVIPGGVEVWARNINSYRLPPPGTPVDAAAWRDGGILDFDSNAGCVIDGRRRENVVWQSPPPTGSYLVRVDTASLCGAPAARWTVSVLRDGTPIGGAAGESLPGDARFSKGPGSGIQALAFDVPAE